MPVKTGEITAKLDGKTYGLHLTSRGISVIQDEFGDDFLKSLQDAGKAERLPPMRLCLRVVELALGKEAAGYDGDLADELLTADLGLIGRIFSAAFPSEETAPDDDKGGEPSGKKQQAAGA